MNSTTRRDRRAITVIACVLLVAIVVATAYVLSPSSASSADSFADTSVDALLDATGDPGVQADATNSNAGASASSSAKSPGLFSASCRLSHVAADDPIVFPGMPGAAHTHEFVGAWSTDAFSTAGSLAASGSTCDPAEDTTAYWAPVLYVRGQRVEVDHFSAYYGWGRKNSVAQRQAIQPWPPGFKMIAVLKDATPEKTGYANGGWLCGNTAVKDGYAPSLTTIAYHCPVLLEARIVFPDCWDGVNLDTIKPDGMAASNPVTGQPYPNDHRSHVAYVNADGNCPADHPVATPRINFQILYASKGLTDGADHRPSADKKGPYDAPADDEGRSPAEMTLAGGGVGGAPINNAYPVDTFHADFFNGWNQAKLESLIDYCIRQAKSQANTRPCLNPNKDATLEAAENPNYPNATQPGDVPPPPPPLPPPPPPPPPPPAEDPVVAIASPAPNDVIAGKLTVRATATDPPATKDGANIGRVEFLVDGVLKGTDKSSAYTYAFDTTKVANGDHTITAVAYDKDNPSHSSSATVAVTVLNVDTTAPKTPGSLSAKALDTSTIRLTWKASTDPSGIDHYNVHRDGALVGTPVGTTYDDGGLAAGTKHAYTVSAVDGAGNVSSSSSKKNAITAKH